MGTITVYGIRNCNTMKKALAWLEERGVDPVFHDYRKAGLDRATAERWLDRLGWEALINKRGTTWRKLSEATRAAMDRDRALEVMLDNPGIIRRPLIERDGEPLAPGFDPERLEGELDV